MKLRITQHDGTVEYATSWEEANRLIVKSGARVKLLSISSDEVEDLLRRARNEQLEQHKQQTKSA